MLWREGVAGESRNLRALTLPAPHGGSLGGLTGRFQNVGFEERRDDCGSSRSVPWG